MMPLTSKAAALFSYIQAHMVASKGVAPTFDQMAFAIGLKSKSGVFRLLTQLEERNAIRRLPNRARAIEIVDPNEITLPPEIYADAVAYARGRNQSVNALVAIAVACWINGE